MKDEFEELVMDESARKSATDWLMQVISGKKSTNGNGNGNGAEHNGAEHNGAGHNGFDRSDGLVISGSTVAVVDMPPAAEVRREERPREKAQEFTAEDLCGAPVVPVIKVASKNEITADDVCWVPAEMRLKPEPAAAPPAVAEHLPVPAEQLPVPAEQLAVPAEQLPVPAEQLAVPAEQLATPAEQLATPAEQLPTPAEQLPTPAEQPPAPPALPPAPASKVHVMAPREGREELDLRRHGGARETELTDPGVGLEPGLTAAEISREPAPYMVRHTLSGMDSGLETREVTAADIMRESARNYVPEPSGSDLPTSFRVIRSAAAPVIEATAPVVEAAAPVIEATAPVIEASAPVVATEAPEAVAAAPIVEEAAAPSLEAAAPAEPVAEPAEAREPIVAAVAEEAAAQVIEVPEAPLEVPALAAEIGDVETSPEQDEADAHEIEEALEHPEQFSEDDLPAELRPEAAVEQGAEGDAREASTNVFAREGFWGSAGQAEVDDGGVPSKAILRGMKRAYTAASASADFEKHPEGWFSAWKTLLRLGSVLPWVARALPALEAGAMGAEPGSAAAPGASGTTGVAQETRQDVAGLRLVQYEIRTTVQDHSMQLKRMEEQLTRVRESVDSRSSESAEVAENLRAMTKLVKMAGMGLGALLLLLLVLVIMMVARH